MCWNNYFSGIDTYKNKDLKFRSLDAYWINFIDYFY